MACIAFIITSHVCTGVGVSFFMDSFPIRSLTIPEFNSIDIKIIDFNTLECHTIQLTMSCTGSKGIVPALRGNVERQSGKELERNRTCHPTIEN